MTKRYERIIKRNVRELHARYIELGYYLYDVPFENLAPEERKRLEWETTLNVIPNNYAFFQDDVV